jgi:LCP family protein required for cell wall assembly
MLNLFCLGKFFVGNDVYHTRIHFAPDKGEPSMIKRLIALLASIVLCFSFAGPALADLPKPITPIPWDELPAVVEGQHHYLLLCVDQWNGNPKNLGNTDGIVLVTLDTRTKRLMLTSFSREMLIQRPDGVIGRINYIAKNYGPEALCNIISTHFGVRVEKYMLFDMNQIEAIVDLLGGVDITVTNSEAEYLKRYAIPDYSTKPRMNRAGTYHFNGHAAVIYMRIRKVGAGGDLGRTQRVRTVLSTLKEVYHDITLNKALELMESILDKNLMTNLSAGEMIEAVQYAMELRGATMEELQIPFDGSFKPITYAGMATREIDFDACRKAIWDYLENSFLVID